MMNEEVKGLYEKEVIDHGESVMEANKRIEELNIAHNILEKKLVKAIEFIEDTNKYTSGLHLQKGEYLLEELKKLPKIPVFIDPEVENPAEYTWEDLKRNGRTPSYWINIYNEWQELQTAFDVAKWYSEEFAIANEERNKLKKQLEDIKSKVLIVPQVQSENIRKLLRNEESNSSGQ